MVNVNVTGGEMSQAEINSYIDRAQKLYHFTLPPFFFVIHIVATIKGYHNILYLSIVNTYKAHEYIL